MKFLIFLFYLFAFSFSLLAQTAPAELLATANGQNFTAADLPADVREAYEQQREKVAELRKSILFEMIAEILIDSEAAAQKTTSEKLVQQVKDKIPAPTEAQIKAVYDANRDRLGNQTLNDVRPQIVQFLRREPEQKALADFVGQLKVKYKAAVSKDVNAPNLRPSDVLATIGAKSITVQQFEQKAAPEVYELKAEIHHAVSENLERAVYFSLVATEAQKSGIASSDLIAREITDKKREFSDEEDERLEEALRQKLFQKYNVKILMKEPEPFVRNISTDDDPGRGNAGAPVTIVMFSDFQCPACAAAHPVLQRVIAEYGADKIRFVVRDFPLPMHRDAFLAAQAAAAAAAQGKFFEYTEMLYRNQDALDAASLVKYAAELGLNAKQFELDLQSGKFAAEVRKDMADGQSYGVSGTPTIFVNGVKVRHLTARDFRAAIEKALQQKAKTK